VTKLLKTNPQERISLEEVLEHPWFLGNPPVKPVTTVVAPATEPTKLPLDSDIIKKENYQVVSKPSIANKAEA
jgi:hypothetical protein